MNMQINLTSDESETLKGYIEALYWADNWADTDEEGQPDPEAELSPETWRNIAIDVVWFLKKAMPRIYRKPLDYTQIGHDFYLSRNGHGTGFWDRSEIYGEPLADYLHEMADSFGPDEFYQGDDGMIYNS